MKWRETNELLLFYNLPDTLTSRSNVKHYLLQQKYAKKQAESIYHHLFLTWNSNLL